MRSRVVTQPNSEAVMLYLQHRDEMDDEGCISSQNHFLHWKWWELHLTNCKDVHHLVARQWNCSSWSCVMMAGRLAPPSVEFHRPGFAIEKEFSPAICYEMELKITAETIYHPVDVIEGCVEDYYDLCSHSFIWICLFLSLQSEKELKLSTEILSIIMFFFIFTFFHLYFVWNTSKLSKEI